MKAITRIARIAAAAALMLLPCTAQGQLLWKVTGKDAKGTSYIFGTHHIAPVSFLDSVAGFKDALAGADALYGEVEMSDITTPEKQMEMVSKYLAAPADSTLSKVLPAAQLDSLNNLLSELSGGMANATMLDGMKPAVASMNIAVMESLKYFPNFNPAEQLDALIQAQAQKLGKPVKGLETVEDQMNLLYMKPISTQAEELMNEVREYDAEGVKSKKLAQGYLTQDYKALDELFEEEIKEDPEKFTEMMFDRNDRWMKNILAQLPKEQMFICVGAGHLITDRGLIEQLRKAGYTVTPVTAAGK